MRYRMPLFFLTLMGTLAEQNGAQWPMLGVGRFAGDYLDLVSPLPAPDLLPKFSNWYPDLSGAQPFEPPEGWHWTNYSKGIEGAGSVLQNSSLPPMRRKILIILTDGILDGGAGDQVKMQEETLVALRNISDVEVYVVLLCRSKTPDLMEQYWDKDVNSLENVTVLNATEPEQWVKNLMSDTLSEYLPLQTEGNWIDSANSANSEPTLTVPGDARLEKVTLVSFAGQSFLVVDADADTSVAFLQQLRQPFAYLYESAYIPPPDSPNPACEPKHYKINAGYSSPVLGFYLRTVRRPTLNWEELPDSIEILNNQPITLTGSLNSVDTDVSRLQSCYTVIADLPLTSEQTPQSEPAGNLRWTWTWHPPNFSSPLDFQWTFQLKRRLDGQIVGDKSISVHIGFQPEHQNWPGLVDEQPDQNNRMDLNLVHLRVPFWYTTDSYLKELIPELWAYTPKSKPELSRVPTNVSLVPGTASCPSSDDLPRTASGTLARIEQVNTVNTSPSLQDQFVYSPEPQPGVNGLTVYAINTYRYVVIDAACGYTKIIFRWPKLAEYHCDIVLDRKSLSCAKAEQSLLP
jgi:hypothetical protein